MRAHPLFPIVVLALLSCSGGSDSPAGPSDPPDDPGPGPGTPPANAAVSVQDDFFSPASVTVRRSSGTSTVTWQWYGSNAHSVIFDVGGPGSPVQSNGRFDREFTTAGSFTYFCSVHGREVMSGTITVQ
jgi:plastocyanin